MSLAQGLYGHHCCKLEARGARCAPGCLFAGEFQPMECVSLLRALRNRLTIQASATHDREHAAELTDMVLRCEVQAQALENITKETQ